MAPIVVRGRLQSCTVERGRSSPEVVALALACVHTTVRLVTLTWRNGDCAAHVFIHIDLYCTLFMNIRLYVPKVGSARWILCARARPGGVTV